MFSDIVFWINDHFPWEYGGYIGTGMIVTGIVLLLVAVVVSEARSK